MILLNSRGPYCLRDLIGKRLKSYPCNPAKRDFHCITTNSGKFKFKRSTTGATIYPGEL